LRWSAIALDVLAPERQPFLRRHLPQHPGQQVERSLLVPRTGHSMS